MSENLLKKGIEIELYAGDNTGVIKPISTSLCEELSYVTQEPDQRNFEYITSPTKDYEQLKREIINPRIEIRKTLKEKWGLNIIPGSTIPLEYDKEFIFSKPEDPYHRFIAKEYQTNVVTTSLHINFGIPQPELIFKILSALRLDCHLFLALSASSCFFDGKLTEYNSFRWHNFPKTPKLVPFFRDQESFIKWTNEKLANKEMFNVRHLWSEIRPNGPKRPTDLDRIEIRICDFVSDVDQVIAIVAFIESIIQKYIVSNEYPTDLKNEKAFKLSYLNQIYETQDEVAKLGLDAIVYDWRTNSKRKVRETISAILSENKEIIDALKISKYTDQINSILEEGNESSKFISHYHKTKSISKTLAHFIDIFEKSDYAIYEKINK